MRSLIARARNCADSPAQKWLGNVRRIAWHVVPTVSNHTLATVAEAVGAYCLAFFAGRWYLVRSSSALALAAF